MHDFKGFLCLALALCLIFALAVPCFADPVTLSGAEFFMSLWGAYASQHGLGMIFSDNGVQSTPTNPFSVQAYREAGGQLIEDFLDYSNSIYSDAEEMYDAFKDEVTVTQDLNNQVIMHWSNTLTEWYDQFANWLLGEEYGLTATESGFTHSSGSFDSPLSSSSAFSFPGGDMMSLSNGYLFGNVSSYDWFLECTGDIFAGRTDSNYLCFLSPVSQTVSLYYYKKDGSLVRNYVTSCNNAIILDGVTYYYGSHFVSFPAIIVNMPVLTYFPPVTTDEVSASIELIQLRPKDKYNEDPTANPIPVPDTTDAGYLPAPQDYVLNPSYVGSLPADITALINSLTDALVENVDPLVAEGEEPAPPSMTPVELPFLGFTLPSFNLGLSSIWHYVIDWVGSLGSGISFIGSVWSNIPYAMVIPIYASAVVVIVLGMFKRFLL